ncbi:MAG: polysaccharide deacetylase family protein [Magnetococcales bacterium]|nr:polysaccharide deacetylase family protein [Magnetococcales bacterium]
MGKDSAGQSFWTGMVRRLWMVPLLVGWLTGVGHCATLESLPLLDFNTIHREDRVSGGCAVTFDDGPGLHTGQLLDALSRRGIKATFFVLGMQARQYPDLVRRMIQEGHEVENHTFDHPDLRKLDVAAREREINETERFLEELGARPHFLRPPYGSYDAALVAEARQKGLQVVLWSQDSEDWKYHTLAAMEGHILPAKGGGGHGIFLFHDIHATTIAAMPTILDDMAQRGCRFVTVAQWAAEAAAPGQAKGWLEAFRQLWR